MLTDFHSHILPGVDDGIRTLDEALGVLERLEREGVESLWLTPHIMEDVPNRTADLRQRFAELQAAYSGPIRLQLAAEYMLDSLFSERFAAGDLLPIGERGDALLVETSCFTPPMDLDGLLARIRSAGWQTILAHPERYYYMDHADYRRLLAAGTRFQLNLGSLAGAYGRDVRRKAKWLLRHGFYTIAGSDLHRERMVDTILTYRHPERVRPLLTNTL